MSVFPEGFSVSNGRDVDHTTFSQSSEALARLNIPIIYDSDPRPTFIVDITLETQPKGIPILHSNSALVYSKDLLSCANDGLRSSTEFSSWIRSTNTHENYCRYAGALWFAFMIKDRWKVVSTGSTSSHLDSNVGIPLTPHSLRPVDFSGDEPHSYENTIDRLKEEIRVRENGRREAARAKQSCIEAVRRLKEEIEALEAATSPKNLSRTVSIDSVAVSPRQDPTLLPEIPGCSESDLEAALEELLPQLQSSVRRQSSPFLPGSKRILPVRAAGNSDDEIALEKFQRLAEAVDVGFFDYDTSGKLLHANDSWYELSGHPRDPELHTPLSFNRCVYPDDEELVMRQWNKLLQGQAVTFEMRWIKPGPTSGGSNTRPEAQWVLSACVPVIGEDGVIKSISGCTTDINAQKQNERVAMQRAEALERARASEERFSRFAEVAPIAIFRFDKHKNMEYCNDRWFEMTGIPKTRFEDVPWPFGVFEDDTAICSAAWERAIIDRSIGQIEFRLRKEWRDDHGRHGQSWVFCTFFAEFGEDGSFMGLMGSLLDISHLKWAEHMQKTRAEEALEAKRQQENFIDITSHEMRNPLSAMVQCADSIMTALGDISKITTGSTELSLKNDTSLIQEHVGTGLDAVQTILSCAAHQKRIVDDILTLSKLDSNLLLITPVKTDPVSMIRGVVKMFEMDCSKAGINLVRELDQSFKDLNIGWLMLDPSRVSQILINLLGNAIKFTRTESRRQVTVRMSASTEPLSRSDQRIEYVPAETIMDDLGDSIEGHDHEIVYLKIEVQDTGRGLTPEEKAKLFMRFSQASPKTHVQYGGSGLGLFICRKLTEMQGGEIGFASQANVGSTFSFYVKTKRTAAPMEELKSPAMEPQLRQSATASEGNLKRGLKVLLVEDNLVNQKVLGKQLEKEGCKVLVAGHGVEALELIKFTPTWHKRRRLSGPMTSSDLVNIDVVLMDIEMPIMGGLECTREIRRLEEENFIVKKLPIISISANARQEQVNEARLAGVDDTITKPFRIRELMPKLNKLVASSL